MDGIALRVVCAEEVTFCEKAGKKECTRYVKHRDQHGVPDADDINCIESVDTCDQFATKCVTPAPCPPQDCVRNQTICAFAQVQCSEVCAKFEKVCVNEVKSCQSEYNICSKTQKICKQAP
eukprot:TRINITY_DN13131_c0_g1_i4.p3 TRINITY_DN13131_c0_g1~~TRINITY_DN13131_c0_g1_i4.p3  ORF type:complete len:121 (+),score=11.49 TRINITY_DN13131_c0_g1_i4:55-417(+)